MDFQLIVCMLVLSLFLIDVAVSIEPITMTVGAAAFGKYKEHTISVSVYDIIRIAIEIFETEFTKRCFSSLCFVYACRSRLLAIWK